MDNQNTGVFRGRGGFDRGRGRGDRGRGRGQRVPFLHFHPYHENHQDRQNVMRQAEAGRQRVENARRRVEMVRQELENEYRRLRPRHDDYRSISESLAQIIAEDELADADALALAGDYEGELDAYQRRVRTTGQYHRLTRDFREQNLIGYADALARYNRRLERFNQNVHQSMRSMTAVRLATHLEIINDMCNNLIGNNNVVNAGDWYLPNWEAPRPPRR